MRIYIIKLYYAIEESHNEIRVKIWQWHYTCEVI